MVNVEAFANRAPQTAMGDAKEFVVFSSLRGPRLSGCKPGPCIQPPGPPTCQPCDKCTVCDRPNDRP